ncbi:MAG: hypothetical protein IPL07_14215, partial [Acidimicrobiaceae bacterium]|nr:hypothetical protein [Acidimicrobiaceae bacterium]
MPAGRAGAARRPSPGAPWLVAGAAIAAVMLVVNPFFTYRYYLLQSRVAVGNKPGGFEVARGDRRFYFGNQALQNSSQAVMDDLDRLSQPGERLLVGPADLSRTIYSDAAFYYMFPELTPATFFIEMDPGLADQEGSRLADDVASADWLILTNFWTGWYEPNASSEFGSDAPNQVVADQFCLVGNYENALVLLYQRCEVGDGISPPASASAPNAAPTSNANWPSAPRKADGDRVPAVAGHRRTPLARDTDPGAQHPNRKRQF